MQRLFTHVCLAYLQHAPAIALPPGTCSRRLYLKHDPRRVRRSGIDHVPSRGAEIRAARRLTMTAEL